MTSSGGNPGARSTREVLNDHLRLRREGGLEADLRRNYAADVILLTSNSILEGHDALRRSADRLHLQLPDARFQFKSLQTKGPYGLLVWEAVSDRLHVDCGADSFLVREGLIRMQTIHYRLLDGEGR